MIWLKWILAYLFHCVHPNTTWPHRDRAGLTYVCCIDCGRELPYSLRRMSIVTSRERQVEPQIETRLAPTPQPVKTEVAAQLLK